ncbi:RNA polymerase sigma factor [Chitinophaga solisilvae]|uniref:Sigma-70 family RNA polymerase sigma factor n=1 Tax=Chitinophaga solisilvae TaxID=1233460 RepID=A0A9Q5D919_9BACT|nr:sigma-70 family RNA polymerase sigma factor [Chitinophaga solisilvae]NSL85890.1 sigma-70 family RNA polymerase sigma factor [Chitinophaga solisilvae]
MLSVHHTDISDQQLLSLWESGDEEAFAQIYRRYFPLLVTTSYHKTRDRFLAEELAQESMLAFYHRKDHRIENIPAYLQIILRNKIYDHFRKALISKQHTAAAMQHKPTTTEDPSLPLYHADLVKSMRQKIMDLPQQCRTVFLLSRERNMSNNEIAAALGISVNTVEQHMRKALKRLREGVLILLVLLFS